MSAKKVSFGARPGGAQPAKPDVDSWVASRAEAPAVAAGAAAEGEPLKRLTVDIPASLHARIKADCAMQGKKISDVVRAWLEATYKT